MGGPGDSATIRISAAFVPGSLPLSPPPLGRQPGNCLSCSPLPEVGPPIGQSCPPECEDRELSFSKTKISDLTHSTAAYGLTGDG